MSLQVISQAVTGAVSGIGDAVSKVAGVFVGNKQERERHGHTENMSVLQQFSAEFGHAKNWFDSLIDGINRLPRPAMALGCIGLLVWCPIDPVGFSAAMVAYETVPIWLGGTIAAIVAFYFAVRHREQLAHMKGPSPEQIAAILNAMREIKAMKDLVVKLPDDAVETTPLPPERNSEQK